MGGLHQRWKEAYEDTVEKHCLPLTDLTTGTKFRKFRVTRRGREDDLGAAEYRGEVWLRHIPEEHEILLDTHAFVHTLCCIHILVNKHVLLVNKIRNFHYFHFEFPPCYEHGTRNAAILLFLGQKRVPWHIRISNGTFAHRNFGQCAKLAHNFHGLMHS